MIHPDAVSVVHYNKKVVPTEVSNSAMVFIIAYLLIVFLSTIIVTFFNVDLATSFGAVVATLGCIGPGIGAVGPAGTYFAFSPFLKYFLSFLMILGRLEVFTVIILFTRSFWRG
ncbi:MAG: TrkH family potassium uptake protein [Bacteroidales bacterium]|nr:TrkH family potassium uptake protein [Bacteroidales bacterium]